MGLVLDSSVLISAEREKLPVSQLPSSLETSYLEARFVLSSITVMELEHGWHRAKTHEAAMKRRRYLDKLLAIFRSNHSHVKGQPWPPRLTLYYRHACRLGNRMRRNKS